MKTLSVRQPWAWALVNGVKTIENRSRRTSHRGPLLIHACRGSADLEIAMREIPELQGREPLVFGAVIGVVDLIDCVPVGRCKGQRFAEGPWCWIVANPRLLKPVFCRGFLGLWDFDPEAASPQTESLEAIAPNPQGVFF